ncbi:MAG: rod shape-determining protein [Firmicutes bacterium]|nr:rod shape-determining protein [Bacillota bacterium]
MTIEIAISMGSTKTSVFQAGYGIVLSEPTIIGLSSENDTRYIGSLAAQMRGKTPDKITLINPIKNGVITEPKMTASFLKDLITRLYPKSYIFKPKVKAILSIPTGLKIEDVEVYHHVAHAAGIKNLRIVPKVMMAAVGLDLPVTSSRGNLVVSIGGGTTDVAVLSLGGIISKNTYGTTQGGDLMDKAIQDHIKGKFNLHIGLALAAKIKEETASLFKNDQASRTISGTDILTKQPAKATISVGDLKDILTPYYLRIADMIEAAISNSTPDLAADILHNGIYLCGGASKIPGLALLLKQKLNLKVTIGDNPEWSAVLGGGKLLKDQRLLEQIL